MKPLANSVFCSAALAVASTALSCAAGEPQRKLNFVLILTDDMGWTDLGCTGSDLYQTPAIDRLAQQGMRFTSAYSACTVCSPTRAALMTGKYPARLHVTDWIPGENHPKAKLKLPDWIKYLPIEEATIAAALKPAGYTSGSIGKWHLGPVQGHLPTDHGFDFNIGGCNLGQPPSYFAPYRIPTLADGIKGEYLTDRETDEACKFIEANKDRPFFLYLPHYCVHTPLQAKADLVKEYKEKVTPEKRHTNAVYAAMIHSLDESTARILAKLDELKLTDNTVVIFTSDNGGLLRSTSNTPLRAGKGSAYEGGVRVPLIVKWPGLTQAGSLSDEPVISMDIHATLLEGAAAGPGAGDANSDGRSLLPLLKDPRAKLEREAIFWHYPHYHGGGASPYSAVRCGDWKLIEFCEDDRAELYNLRDDIGEQQDLAAKMLEKAAELRKRVHDWRAAVNAQMPTPNPDYDPKIQRKTASDREPDFDLKEAGLVAEEGLDYP
jgi:arylsulfatase A